jgi:hypothetical protein
MAKKKTVTLDCDFKLTYNLLYDVTEAVSTYGIAGISEADKHALQKIVNVAEDLIEAYTSEVMEDPLDGIVDDDEEQ